MPHTFEYPVMRYRVIDGDSVEIDCDMGFSTYRTVSVRLMGIDAPERGTIAGKGVTGVVRRWVDSVSTSKYRLLWVSRELDKYGRSLGNFVDAEHPTESLVKYLLDEKLVRVYDGGKREAWGEDELKAIEERAGKILESGDP